ncbi:hypothetical protein PF005_g2284 [Phytophthora fragariae]|uniref:Uncharacterized protein n=1 Tax=Phytophthora fragariae TaxID=53985 RepID=A0A6A3TIM9_9STRA|nr:hypothetical protein PF007_g1644 [Phytophthora fragariae]KAE9233503.1 hypothetical protein PF005_g2284 [Phytophthora fragariae]
MVLRGPNWSAVVVFPALIGLARVLRPRRRRQCRLHSLRLQPPPPARILMLGGLSPPPRLQELIYMVEVDGLDAEEVMAGEGATWLRL